MRTRYTVHTMYENNNYRVSLLSIFWFFALVALEPRIAHAYLDPGNGSYFIQIAIAVVLGGLVAMKSSFSKIKGVISRLFSRRQNKK